MARREQFAPGGQNLAVIVLVWAFTLLPLVLAAPPDQSKTPGRDTFGDPLPPGAVVRLGTQRLHHGGEVAAVAWSPDGKWLASGGGFSDYAVSIWDVATGKEAHRFLQHTAANRSLAFTHDGKMVASTDQSGVLYVWVRATGVVVNRFGLARGSSIAFGPSPRSYAAIDGQNRACLFELATGRPLRLFEDGRTMAAVTLLAWSADAETLASVDGPNKLRLFDVTSGRLTHTLSPAEKVLSIAVAPEGHLLATGAANGTVTLWDVAGGKLLRRLRGHGAAVNVLSWSPDGKTLASASADRTVRGWDVDSGRQVWVFTGHQAPVLSVAFSPDGKRVASGGDDFESTVRIWDPATRKEVFSQPGHNGWVGILHPLEDGKTLLTAGSDGTLRHWDLAAGKCRAAFRGEQSRGKAGAIAPGGKLAATGDAERTIRFFELPGGKLLRQIEAHEGTVHTLAFSPDGKILASAGKDQMLYLWDVATGERLRQLESHAEIVYCFLFSADGKRLFTAGSSGVVRIWEVATGSELGVLPLQAAMEQIALSPDEKLLASISKDGTARLWDLEAGKEVRKLEGLGVGYSIAFSPDGRSFATGTGDRLIHLFETATGKERLRLEGHRGAVSAITFMADGKTLLSGSSDGTVLVWDLALRSRETSDQPRLAAEDVEAQWRMLHGEDTAGAYRALWTLAAAPAQALPRLRLELQPVPILDPKQLAQWITDLGHDRFAVRNKATNELKRLGDLAWPALRKVLENPPSAEVAARARRLLGKEDALLPTQDRLRLSRSLELLERLGTTEARDLARALAQGEPKAWLTQEARAMVRRMN
jgi:WD40 repeat protein